MSRLDQIAYIQSLMDNISAVLIKLDKPTESFQEPGIHEFIHKHRITSVIRSSFDEYDSRELWRAVGKCKLILSGYQKTWWKRCEEHVEVRDELKTRAEEIIRDCLTREAAMEWMGQNTNARKLIEYFMWAGVVRETPYWRRREKPITLYTFSEATRQYKSLCPSGETPFEKLFEESLEQGWHEMLYRPLFTQEIAYKY